MSQPLAESALAAMRSSEADIAAFRQTTMEERAAMLSAACRAALALERARIASGLPPSHPAPWPPSTWEFLARHAADVRARAE